MNADRDLNLSVATGYRYHTCAAFDQLILKLKSERLSFEESTNLASLCGLGELVKEISFRDDVRFRRTPGDRWILTDSFLANDSLYDRMTSTLVGSVNLEAELKKIDEQTRKHAVFCPKDNRFILVCGSLRIAAGGLSDKPLIRDQVEVDEQYRTHLPLLRLQDAAYRDYRSLPDDDILTLAEMPPGWIRVDLSHTLDRSMFIARIEDNSMNDGQNGIRKCDYCVFSYQSDRTPTDAILLVRGVFGQTGIGFHHLRHLEYREPQQILLLPLHPDRDRYPEIRIDLADGDEVVAVASLIEVLSPAMYERSPGTDDDCRTLARQGDKFYQRMQRFFETNGGQGRRLAKRFAVPICLAADAGCLQIEIGPVPGFVSFVSELRLLGDGWEKICPTANIRNRARRIAVAPWTESLSWEPVGFEHDDILDLAAFALPGLPPDRVTVFRVDGQGIGRLVVGGILPAGHCYRLLIPPTVLATLAECPPLTKLDYGWSLLELELAVTVGSEMVELLTDLGLNIGTEQMTLEWVIVPPVEWSLNWNGDSYPGFLSQTGLILKVDGPLIESEGEAALLLHASDEPRVFPLAPGRRNIIRLSNLPPGRYGVEIVHQRRDIRVEPRFFEVVESPRPSPPANCRIRVAGHWYDLAAGGTLRLASADLSMLANLAVTGGETGLEIETPPGWPVRIFWKSLTTELILDAHANQEGRFDSSPLPDLIRQRLKGSRIGELVFDLRELGRVVLPHQPEPDVEAIHEAMTDLVINLAPNIRRNRGQYLLTIPHWFTPVLSLLGYTIADCPGVTAADGLRVLKLFHEERTMTGYAKLPSRLLFLSPELRPELENDQLNWMDRVAVDQQVRETLLSDGLRWAVRRRGSRLPLKIRDLEWIIDDQDLFIDFLRESGEGL